MVAANPLKGEVRIELEDGREFLAVFDIDAICAMEDLRDRPVVQIMAQVAQGRISFVRDALWAALRRHHKDIKVVEVGEMLTKIKGQKKAADLVFEGIKNAFPAPKDGEGEGEGDENPPTAPAEDGTGKGS